MEDGRILFALHWHVEMRRTSQGREFVSPRGTDLGYACHEREEIRWQIEVALENIPSDILGAHFCFCYVFLVFPERLL